MPSPFKLNVEKTKKLRELSSQGKSHGQLASQFGISHSAVHYYLNPEVRARRRKRRAEGYLRVREGGRGRWVKLRVKKRPRPEKCELCREPPSGRWKLLNWHHWDPIRPEIGLWLCVSCHWFVGGVERGLMAERYLELKEFEGWAYEFRKLEARSYEANPLTRGKNGS